MPNAPTHTRAAVPAGAALAIYRSRNQTTGQLCEAIGGAIGGWVGGKAPDNLDPAICWNHRRFFHSWTALGAGLVLSDALLVAWENFFRQKADEMRLRQTTEPNLDAITRIFLAFWEAVFRTAAGALAGFLAGYASHLVLDSFTVSSLPFFGLDCSNTPPPRVPRSSVPLFVTDVKQVGSAPNALRPLRKPVRRRRTRVSSVAMQPIAPAP